MRRSLPTLAVLLAVLVLACSAFELHFERRGSKVDAIRESVNSGSYTGDSDVIVPLEGNQIVMGEYYLEMHIGTPPRRFTAQIDTGSADLAIPSTSCSTSSCGQHADSYYNPSQSSTSSAIGCNSGLHCVSCTSQCQYTLSYLDGSGFTAKMYSDKITVGDMGHTVTQNIGAIVSEVTNGFPFEPYDIDGIIGFAYQSCSATRSPTLMDNLAASGIPNIFSMCVTMDGGVLTIGEPGSHHVQPIVYTPIIDEFFYTIYMTDLLVNGVSIGVSPNVYNSGGVVVDSGTTDIIMPSTAYNAIKNKIVANCGKVNLYGMCGVTHTIWDGYCFSMQPNQIAAYPTLEFVFDGGVTVEVSPNNYLVQGYCSDESLYAIAIDPAPLSYGVILGDTFMRNVETVFDRANKQIGFAPVDNCT